MALGADGSVTFHIIDRPENSLAHHHRGGEISVYHLLREAGNKAVSHFAWYRAGKERAGRAPLRVGQIHDHPADRPGRAATGAAAPLSQERQGSKRTVTCWPPTSRAFG